MKRLALALAAPLVLVSTILSPGCSVEKPSSSAEITIVFKHGKIAGDPVAFEKILRDFETANPDIHVKDEPLPSSTDEQHQFYTVNLEGGSPDFDLLSMDVIWVPEFARAGWLKNLSQLFPVEEQEAFFEAPTEAARYENDPFAIPWYIDAGLLYYRSDLLEKYGFSPPVTWDELVRAATTITEAEPDLYGYIWQGKQYEGLVCNVLEYIWSHGGDILRNGAVVIDSPENERALAFMRDLIREFGITPDFVTTSTEEPVRRIFGKGEALFMRNWPYAWTLFQRDNSPVRGKVGVSTLPSLPGQEPASTLGGWHLGIARQSEHPEAAERLIRFLTSHETQKEMTLRIGYMPTRKALYQDEDLLIARPFLTSLFQVFEHARPRPVTPFYMMISQVLQPEFSAVLAGIKEPADALSDAADAIAFLLRDDP